MLGRRPAGVSEWMGVSGEQRVMDQRRLIWRAWAPLLHHCSTLHPYQQLLPCASCIMRPTKILVNECNCMPKEVPTWEGGHEQALQVLGPARIALIRLNVVQLQAAGSSGGRYRYGSNWDIRGASHQGQH
jgi:hypothetical protein